jgi:soluble P-type ATPase
MAAPELNATNGLIVNNATVSANYTVASGNNAFSVGPMTVNSGVSVTVSSGQRWVVI